MQNQTVPLSEMKTAKTKNKVYLLYTHVHNHWENFNLESMSSCCLMVIFCLFSLPQRFVKMAVWTEEGAWLPTDVFVRTASPEPSVREVMNPTQLFSPPPLHPTSIPLSISSTFQTRCCFCCFRTGFQISTCDFCKNVTPRWSFCRFLWLVGHAARCKNSVCRRPFVCQAQVQKWPLFSTSALKRHSGERNYAVIVHCLVTEDLPSSCGCFLAYVSKDSPVYKHTQSTGNQCCVWGERSCARACSRACCSSDL